MIDLHVHTARCNHAEGSVEDYVRVAIAKGLDVIGFNDHFPMLYLPRSIPVDNYAMRPGEFPAYLADLDAVKERFSGQIEVKIATEVDFFSPALDEITRSLAPYIDRFDYVYGSVHVVDDWAVDDDRFMHRWDDQGEDAVFTRYWENVESMVRTGLFDVVGHLDLPKKFNKHPRGDMTVLVDRVLDAIATSGMVVEVNTSGLRKPVGEVYPSPSIITRCHERGIPLTLGSDAHAPGEVGHAFNETIVMLRGAGYREIASFTRRRKEMLALA